MKGVDYIGLLIIVLVCFGCVVKYIQMNHLEEYCDEFHPVNISGAVAHHIGIETYAYCGDASYVDLQDYRKKDQSKTGDAHE